MSLRKDDLDARFPGLIDSITGAAAELAPTRFPARRQP
jgi:hypothetical protein